MSESTQSGGRPAKAETDSVSIDTMPRLGTTTGNPNESTTFSKNSQGGVEIISTSTRSKRAAKEK
ncbi:hypothetical protein [Rhodococcus sp. 1139]|uniref:hypothetical protein n=1 Tax=Rhodococcus sp. 1139 TaxID=1833762 RepID=UPI00114CAF9C|nr:hypothetical protein [Rhodococcus sp. 1139]